MENTWRRIPAKHTIMLELFDDSDMTQSQVPELELKRSNSFLFQIHVITLVIVNMWDASQKQAENEQIAMFTASVQP